MTIQDQRQSIQRVLQARGLKPAQGSSEELASGINKGLQETHADHGILGTGLSVLGRAFDLLGRPLNTITNTVQSLTEGENLGHAVQEGVTEGLTGKDKVSFSKILGDAGVENPLLRGVGGFGLDVALDPLTYVGVGIARKAGEEALATGGAKAAQEIIREAGVKGSVTSLKADVASIGAYRDAIRSGIKDVNVLDDVKKTAREALIEREAMNASKSAKIALQTEEPGRVVLKALGKEVAGSEKLYKAGGSAIDWLKETKLGNGLNKAFRPEATFVAGTNNTRRATESLGWSEAEKLDSVVDNGGNYNGDFFPGLRTLGEDEGPSLAHALESAAPVAGTDLEPHAQAMRALFDRMHEIRSGMMIDPELPLQAGPRLGNYLPHYFDRALDSPEDIAEWYSKRKSEISKLEKIQDEGVKKALQDGYKASKAASPVNSKEELLRAQATRASAKAAGIKDKAAIQELVDQAEEGFHLEQGRAAGIAYQKANPIVSTYTLDRAGLEGLHPVTDMRQIARLAIKDHFSQIGRFKYSDAVINEFGVDLGKGARGAQMAKKLGMAPVKGKLVSKIVPEGIYLPKEIADGFKKLDRVFFEDEAAGSELVNLYDKGLRHVKFFQTVFNPGHHIRNALTDITQNFMDGVTSVEPYGLSAKIMRRVGKADSTLFDAAEGGLRQSLESLHDIKIPVGKVELNGEQLWNYFIESGGKSGFFTAELGPAKAGFTEKIRHVSEAREDWARLAHFIDSFQKEGKNIKSLDNFAAIKDAAARAGTRVRKFNIDYGNLTPFEQRVMRRVVPFYTWQRKNLPLQIENFFMRPGRTMVAPKGINALKTILGNNDPEDTSIMGLNYLPDYLQQAFSVALTGEGEGRNGIYWNPGQLFPVMDLDRTFGSGSPRDIVEGQLSGLTPAISLPIQQITGYNFFTGRPQDKGVTQSSAELFPVGRYLWGTLAEGKPWASTQLANLGVSGGLTSLNEGMERGELRRQEDIVQALLRRKREQEKQAAGG